MKDLILEIESYKDSIGRIKYSKIPDDLLHRILLFYQNGEKLNKKDLISSFYRGHLCLEKCLNPNCDNFQKWDNNKLLFRPYCSIKCSNADPEKDKITIKNNMEKYGVPRASMTKESKNKLLRTNMERFGFKSSSMHPDIKEKAKVTNLKKYNHNSSSIGNIRNLSNYNDFNFISEKFIKEDMFLLDEFMEYFNCGQVAAHNTLKRLNIKYSKYKSKGNTGIERKIEKFLTENNINFISKYRDGFELDFYLPDYNVGIECDGLYYHSYGYFSFGKDKKYFKNRHLDKQKYFKDKNIVVMFLWENEINDPIKFNIWCSMIKYKVLKNSIRIYARNTSIREISNLEKKEFLIYNHIQGNTISSYAYGLINNGELIALMSFAKSDKNKNFEYELKRFCVKCGYSIIGGASKLLKHFEKTIKPNSLITYLNKRWSISDDFYKQIGFVYSNESEPSKFIIDNDKVRNRLQFQKYKLKNIKNFTFDESLTADENIINNGYRLMWDNGNKVYYKNYKE